jgi:hypothetical protein
LFAAGFTASAAALALIVYDLPGTYVWWAIYGLGASVNVLAFTVLNDGFATELAGRANTAVNLVTFSGKLRDAVGSRARRRWRARLRSASRRPAVSSSRSRSCSR